MYAKGVAMNIQIIADSCCDLTQTLRNVLRIKIASLKIDSNGNNYVDDENIDIKALLADMKASKDAVTTACPSPDDYAKLMQESDASFVITLSSKLSGSHNAASIARDIVLESNPEKKICILDSKAAACGELRIALLLRELIDAGHAFDEIAKTAGEFIDKMRTLFVLEDLSNLVKNGRISKVAGLLGSMLSLRPIMGEDGNGEIALIEKVRGTQNAMKRLVETVSEMTHERAEKSTTLVLSYCNCPDRATDLKKEFLTKCAALKDVILVPTSGLSTAYANDGGIIISF